MKYFLAVIMLVIFACQSQAQYFATPEEMQAYYQGYSQGYQAAMVQLSQMGNQNSLAAYYNYQKWLTKNQWRQQNQTQLAVLAWHARARANQIQTPLHVVPNNKKK
jgi:outer membrane lipoprotein-sorting protein